MTTPSHDLHARDFALGADMLRSSTELAHQEVERIMALPGSIETMADYRRWLVRFFGIYQPLEYLLRGFAGWTATDIRPHQMGHTEALLKDLKVLKFDPDHIELASQNALPVIETFGQAFGALYVLEGSKLGGRHILRDLSNRLGREIEGRDAFLTGNGAYTAIRWASFKASLNHFSALRPAEFPEIIAGAKMTFAAIGDWMLPLADKRA